MGKIIPKIDKRPTTLRGKTKSCNTKVIGLSYKFTFIWFDKVDFSNYILADANKVNACMAYSFCLINLYENQNTK